MPHLFYSSTSQHRYYAWFEALHTRVDLLLLATLDEEGFERVEEEVRLCLEQVAAMGNRFDPKSELSRAVQAATQMLGQPIPLSLELFGLLERCRRAHRETGGLFDITVNSPCFEPGLMDAVELMGTIPYDKIARRNEEAVGGWLCLHREGIILDLSGVLKGYALERVRTLLSKLGLCDALINLGNSSLLSLGSNPSDIPSGYVLTTSGNATVDRRHIRNPLTAEWVEGVCQVSVTTSDAVEGEIQSTVTLLRASS